MTISSTLTDPRPPRVLFIGSDASSPEIAASLLRRLVGDRVVVDTAGTKPTDPGGRSDEMLVAMGLNPAHEQRLSTTALYAADRVVVLGTGLDVARLSGASYEEWDLADGDLISRVQALSDEFTTVFTTQPAPSVRDRLRKLLRASTRR